MTQPTGHRPFKTETPNIQEPTKQKESSFGRVVGFFTGSISSAWHHIFQAEQPAITEELPKRTITHYDDDHVIESGPAEGLTVSQAKKIIHIFENTSLSPKQREQEISKALATVEQKDEYETEEDTLSSVSSSEMSSLIEENSDLKEKVEVLTKENQALRSLQGSPREQELMNLCRELIASGAVPVTRTPYTFSAEHLAVSFVQDVLVPKLGKGGDWFERKTIEKDGKKIPTSRLTEAGKPSVEILENLGVITQDATAQGGVLYRPQPKWNDDKALAFIRREFTNWAEGQTKLVIDSDKAEGFYNFSNPDAYKILDKYSHSASVQDSKKAADSLGFPPRDELFKQAISLARAYALEVVENKATELFENAKDRTCMQDLQGDFKTYPKLKEQVAPMKSKHDEGIQGLQAHLTELDAKASETQRKQALIESILSGDTQQAKQQVNPHAPPPPPPPPGF